MGRAIPDRWLNYSPIGKQIKGTRFIPFKVPLSEDVNGRVKNVETRLDINTLLREIPNLGLVIDLTQTTRYYDPSIFTKKGIQHIKLMIHGGGRIPDKKNVDVFARHVDQFLSNDINKDKLIGVHCTHGVNRTGYLICQHMVRQHNIAPETAIDYFESARGHPIERANYRDGIINQKNHSNSINHRRRSPEQNWRNGNRRDRDRNKEYQSLTNIRRYQPRRVNRNRIRDDLNERSNVTDRHSVMNQVYNDDQYSWRRDSHHISQNSWRRK